MCALVYLFHVIATTHLRFTATSVPMDGKIIDIEDGHIQRYTPFTVTQTAPFQTINLNIDIVVSRELNKQVAFEAKLSKSSEADIIVKERGFNQS